MLQAKKSTCSSKLKHPGFLQEIKNKVFILHPGYHFSKFETTASNLCPGKFYKDTAVK